jgi:hypothetical protein
MLKVDILRGLDNDIDWDFVERVSDYIAKHKSDFILGKLIDFQQILTLLLISWRLGIMLLRQ